MDKNRVAPYTAAEYKNNENFIGKQDIDGFSQWRHQIVKSK